MSLDTGLILCPSVCSLSMLTNLENIVLIKAKISVSASLWNKNSSSTTASRENTIQPAICITENPNNYFTFRESVLARALTECKEQFLDEEADGPLLEAFLLTQYEVFPEL